MTCNEVTRLDNDYQRRVVRLEDIHQVDQRQFDQLAAAVDPSMGMTVLDAGAGYGAVSRELAARSAHLELSYHLLEISGTQLAMAPEELAKVLPKSLVDRTTVYHHASVLDANLPTNCYDRIVAKLLWHELPQHEQPQLATELFRMLAPGGKLVLWHISLQNPELASFYRSIIREKDRLAGYHSLVSDRYFTAEDELKCQLQAAGFQGIRRESLLRYDFNSQTRLSSDFRGDETLLWAWNQHIAAAARQLSAEQKQSLHYRAQGNSHCAEFAWGLYVAYKK